MEVYSCRGQANGFLNASSFEFKLDLQCFSARSLLVTKDLEHSEPMLKTCVVILAE